jgi:hypothetical protein
MVPRQGTFIIEPEDDARDEESEEMHQGNGNGNNAEDSV